MQQANCGEEQQRRREQLLCAPAVRWLFALEISASQLASLKKSLRPTVSPSDSTGKHETYLAEVLRAQTRVKTACCGLCYILS